MYIVVNIDIIGKLF